MSVPVSCSCARTGYRPGSARAGIVSATSASRCSPGGSVNGSAAGLADQPGGHTSVTVPASGVSLLSLATVKRSATSVSAAAVEPVRMQMSDRGQPAQRRRSAVVQPVPRVQRLAVLGLRGQRGVVGVQQPGQVESRQRGADLVAVQRRRVGAALGRSSRSA